MKLVNFLHTQKKINGRSWANVWKTLQKARSKKTIVIIAVIMGVLLVTSGLWIAFNYRYIKTINTEAHAAKQSFLYAEVAIGTQNFNRAQNDLGEANEHFRNALSALDHFPVLRRMPFLKKQFHAVEYLLSAGVNLSSGLQTLTKLGDDVTSVLHTKERDITFGDIQPSEKRAMLKALAESPADLAGVRADIELAVLLLEQIPNSGLLGPIHDVVQPVRAQLPILETLIEQALPIVEALPSLAGYPHEKTYLFLLQNNHELRPTGGFIGTYGIMKLDAGEIKTFETDNVYNLDEPMKDSVTELAPGPIAQHTSTQHAFMRNANWSPDFPTSAREVRRKYFEEGGKEKQIDGVIAVTPTFLASLLDVTGPITVADIEFTSENFFDKLEQEVQFGFQKKGKNISARKDIIGVLGKELMTRLFSLPKERFGNLWNIFVRNVNEKHILIYVDDVATQNLIRKQGWDGEMPSTTDDLIMVVDANVAALKTDRVMERTINYHFAKEGNDLTGNLDVHYRNTGTITRLTTRYRTYTRIYIPNGATVLDASGYMTGDKIQGGRPTEPDVSTETFTKSDGTTTTLTVVSGFIAIEPQEEGTLHLHYRLPDTLRQKIENENLYRLLVVKQPGTLAHGLDFSLDIGHNITTATPLDVLQERGNNTVHFVTNISSDRNFQITFK